MSLYKVKVWVEAPANDIPGATANLIVLAKEYYVEARSSGGAQEYAKKLYMQEFLPDRVRTSATGELIVEHVKED